MRTLRPSTVKKKNKAVNSPILILSTLSLKRALTLLLLTNLKDGQLQPLSSPAAPCRVYPYLGPNETGWPGTKMAHTTSGSWAGSRTEPRSTSFPCLTCILQLSWPSSSSTSALSSSAPQLFSSRPYRLVGHRGWLHSTLPVTRFMENCELLSFATCFWPHQHLLSSPVIISWALSSPPRLMLASFSFLFFTHYSISFLPPCLLFISYQVLQAAS